MTVQERAAALIAESIGMPHTARALAEALAEAGLLAPEGERQYETVGEARAAGQHSGTLRNGDTFSFGDEEDPA